MEKIKQELFEELSNCKGVVSDLWIEKAALSPLPDSFFMQTYFPIDIKFSNSIYAKAFARVLMARGDKLSEGKLCLVYYLKNPTMDGANLVIPYLRERATAFLTQFEKAMLQAVAEDDVGWFQLVVCTLSAGLSLSAKAKKRLEKSYSRLSSLTPDKRELDLSQTIQSLIK